MTIPSTVDPVPPAPPTEPTAARRGDRPSGRRLPPRAAFVVHRFGRAVLCLAVVVVATFAIVHLVPGDPVRAALGPSATPELVASTRAQLGLDTPVARQFLAYVAGLPRGDLGVSLQTHRDVGTTLTERLPATLTLALLGFVLAALGALIVGITTAVGAHRRRHRVADAVVSWLLGGIIAVPELLSAIGLVALFGITLGVLPVAGWGGPDQAILPIVALALGPMAYLARIVHVEMLAVLDTPYLTTARSKRLPARLLYLRHALPNMITGALTAGGLVLSGMVAGTVVIETVFAIPGLGTTIVSSITAKDYPMIQGVVLVYATLVLALNLLVDLILATVDPRSSIMEG